MLDFYMDIEVNYSTWYMAEFKSGDKKTMSTPSFKIWTWRPLNRAFLRSCIGNNTDRHHAVNDNSILQSGEKEFLRMR